MRTTLAHISASLSLSLLIFAAACNDSGGDPTAVWDDERVRNQGTLTVSPSSFQVREGESVALHAHYQGTADFSPSGVSWRVWPVGAGSVENGVFKAEVAGDVTIEGRFSSLADTAEATIRPELIDFLPVSDSVFTAAAGQVVSDSVAVQVVGRRNAPVPGEVIDFEVVDGDGNVSRRQRVTGPDGIARVAWLLGPRPGENRLRSLVERFELRFRAEGRPDRSSARLRRAAAELREGTVGELLQAPLVVEVADAQGNPLPNVLVKWTFPDGRGMADLESTTFADTVLVEATDERGRTRAFWKLGDRAGSQEALVSLVTEELAPGERGNGNGNGGGQMKFEASVKPGQLATLEVQPAPVSASVGSTVALSVSGTDEHGNDIGIGVGDVKWSSSDPAIASVDGNGSVTAVGGGAARITAKVGPVRDEIDVTVVGPEPAAVASVVASHDEVLFDRLENVVDVTASAYDDQGTVVGDADLAWSSSDVSVVSVSAGGAVTAVANGTAEIVVSAECCEAADTVFVQVDEPAVLEVRASATDLSFGELGAEKQIGVELFDARGSQITEPVEWWSGDPLVASVDASGKVTAVSNGSTQVVVSAQCCQAADTVGIMVHEPVLDYIEVTPKSVDLTVGDTTAAEAVGHDTAGDTADVEVTWTSTDETVAEVDQVGMIIAKGKGIAAIVAAAACCTASDTVLVGVDEEPIAPSRVEASWESIQFRALEQTFQLDATALDEWERLVEDARFTWSSTDPSTVTVDSMGLVTARANGIAAIVVASACCTVADTVPVTVEQEVASVLVLPSSLSFSVGETQTLEGSAFDANSFEVDVPLTWSSMDTGVATVSDGGQVTARAEGATTAQASAEGVAGLADIVVGDQALTGVAGGPNEPADYLPIVGREFNSKASSGSDRGTGDFPWKVEGSEGFDGHESSESLLTIVSDPTSPLSPPNVMAFEYPAQTVADGTTFTPGQMQTQNFQNANSGLNSPLDLQEIYNRFTFKLGPNYDPHPAGNKLVFYRQFHDGRLVNGPLMGLVNGDGALNLVWDLQGTEDNARQISPIGDNAIELDRWYEVEVNLILNTAPGVADGQLHMWIQPVGGARIKIFEQTDLRLRAAADTDSNGFFSSVRHDPTFGGQGGTIDQTYFLFVGHHWVSGR